MELPSQWIALEEEEGGGGGVHQVHCHRIKVEMTPLHLGAAEGAMCWPDPIISVSKMALRSHLRPVDTGGEAEEIETDNFGTIFQSASASSLRSSLSPRGRRGRRIAPPEEKKEKHPHGKPEPQITRNHLLQIIMKMSSPSLTN